MRAINDYVGRIQFISIKLSAYVAGTYTLFTVVLEIELVLFIISGVGDCRTPA